MQADPMHLLSVQSMRELKLRDERRASKESVSLLLSCSSSDTLALAQYGNIEKGAE